jgi:hypothetical protein
LLKRAQGSASTDSRQPPVHSFDATYDADGAASAERVFYVRSVRELRRLSTFGPPVIFSVIVAVGFAFSASTGFVALFSAFLLLSLLGPVLFYIARPLSAKRLALKYPVRHIKLTSEELQIAVGQQTAHIAWGRVKHVWDAGEYVLLVLSQFTSISIPKRSLPTGASEFIHATVKNAD